MNRKRQLALIGETIRKLREDAGMTQDEMAHNAEFSRSYYGGVERGVRNVSSINLIKIASVLDVEVGKLFPKISKFRK